MSHLRWGILGLIMATFSWAIGETFLITDHVAWYAIMMVIAMAWVMFATWHAHKYDP